MKRRHFLGLVAGAAFFPIPVTQMPNPCRAFEPRKACWSSYRLSVTAFVEPDKPIDIWEPGIDNVEFTESGFPMERGDLGPPFKTSSVCFTAKPIERVYVKGSREGALQRASDPRPLIVKGINLWHGPSLRAGSLPHPITVHGGDTLKVSYTLTREESGEPEPMDSPFAHLFVDDLAPNARIR